MDRPIYASDVITKQLVYVVPAKRQRRNRHTAASTAYQARDRVVPISRSENGESNGDSQFDVENYSNWFDSRRRVSVDAKGGYAGFEEACSDLIVPTPTLEEKEKQAEIRTAVESAFSDLRPHHRQVLEMRYVECMTLQEIGHELGCRFQAIQDRLTVAEAEFHRRWEVGSRLMAATEVAAVVGRTSRWVRDLGKRIPGFAPTFRKPRQLWTVADVDAIKEFLSSKSSKPGWQAS